MKIALIVVVALLLVALLFGARLVSMRNDLVSRAQLD